MHASPEMASKDQLVEILRDIIAPLVEADAGQLWLVSADDVEVKVHLAGTCAGCPGATLTTRGVIEPALRSVSTTVRVTVSSGYTIPQGAERISAAQRVA